MSELRSKDQNLPNIFQPAQDFLKQESRNNHDDDQKAQNPLNLKDAQVAEAPCGIEWRETQLLGDCVWFLLRLAKMQRESRRQQEPQPQILHHALALLNKYAIKKGLKASLVS